MAHTNADVHIKAKFKRNTNENDSKMANVCAWCAPIQHKFKLVDLNATCDPDRELETYVRESLQGFSSTTTQRWNRETKNVLATQSGKHIFASRLKAVSSQQQSDEHVSSKT